MAATVFRITFTDGEVREVRRRIVHEVRAEAMCTKEDGPLFKVMAGIWAADTGGKTGRAAYEAWLDTVEDWDRVDAEEQAETGADADPPAEQSGATPG